MEASTQRTAIRAAFADVCPDGYDRLSTRPTVSCHSGRPRPMAILTRVVMIQVENTTRTA